VCYMASKAANSPVVSAFDLCPDVLSLDAMSGLDSIRFCDYCSEDVSLMTLDCDRLDRVAQGVAY